MALGTAEERGSVLTSSSPPGEKSGVSVGFASQQDAKGAMRVGPVASTSRPSVGFVSHADIIGVLLNRSSRPSRIFFPFLSVSMLPPPARHKGVRTHSDTAISPQYPYESKQGETLLGAAKAGALEDDQGYPAGSGGLGHPLQVGGDGEWRRTHNSVKWGSLWHEIAVKIPINGAILSEL
jgi:hypothetical protein